MPRRVSVVMVSSPWWSPSSVCADDRSAGQRLPYTPPTKKAARNDRTAFLALRTGGDLERRAPGDRYDPVTAGGLLDVADRRERIVIALHHHLFRGEHVVELAPGPFRHWTIHVEAEVPARIYREQRRVVGHVGLDHRLGGARRQDVRRVAW